MSNLFGSSTGQQLLNSVGYHCWALNREVVERECLGWSIYKVHKYNREVDHICYNISEP